MVYLFYILLSIFDKIMEKLIHKRLCNSLEEHNVLYYFRKNNSTVFALVKITEMIKASIDSGKFGCGIFIDLNHEILLNKLEHYGVRDSMLNWFKSYLIERKQYVSFNGQSSLQKRAIRLMTFNDVFPAIPGPLHPTDPIFVKLKYMKVQDICKYQSAKFVFKCLNQTAPEQLHNWYKRTHEFHGYHTRSNFNVNDGTIINNLSTPSACTTNYGLKQIKVNCPRIWNDALLI